MADSPAITQLIATVQYSEKVPTSVRYANAEAGLFLQVDVTGLSLEDADAAIVAAYGRVKSLVEGAISAPESIDAVTVVQDAFPGAQVERGQKAQTNQLAVGTAYTAKADHACEQCGSLEFADNRAAKKAGTVKPRYPDFKCVGDFNGKPCGKGVWLPDRKKADAAAS